MKVKIHALFQYLLDTTEIEPEAFIGFSLATSPRLGAFLSELDPDLSLDWNGVSFLGRPDLRARVLAQAGLQGLCQPDDILITAGAAEANYLAFMQLVQPGDEVVVERPGWPQAEVLARAKGVRVRVIERSEAEGWQLPLDQVQAAITPATKLIFLSNPNNPTGAVTGRADLESIVAMADRVGAWLLVDEVYAGLEWDVPRAPSVAGLYPRGITTGSVSKALGLQGLRTGWMICPDAGLIRDAVILRENSSEIMNILGEAIAEIALRPDRLQAALSNARRAGSAALDLVDRFVSDHTALHWRRPQAGLIGLARLAEGINSAALADHMLRQERTFVLPGTVYDLPQHIRVGVGGGAESNLSLGLDRLGRVLSDWPVGD